MIWSLHQSTDITDIRFRNGSYEDKTLTWIRLKLTCQLLPALEGMNLSPYLSFCGEFTGVICFLGIRGYKWYLNYELQLIINLEKIKLNLPKRMVQYSDWKDLLGSSLKAAASEVSSRTPSPSSVTPDTGASDIPRCKLSTTIRSWFSWKINLVQDFQH